MAGRMSSPGLSKDRAGKGLFEDQTPFRPDVTFTHPQATLSRLGLSGLIPVSPKLRDAICSIVANLAVLPADKRMFYSRDKNHYPAMRRYRPAFYTYECMMRAVDVLESAGSIYHWKTPRLEYPTFRSSMRPSAELEFVLKDVVADDFNVKARECLILRGPESQPMAYRETPFTRRARPKVEAYNEAAEAFSLTICHPDVAIDEGGFLSVRNERLPLAGRGSCRIFKERFDQGGRWYGPFWQNLPSAIRKEGLRIGGECVVEEDYSACHLRILSRLVGIPMSSLHADPYSLPGAARKHVKFGFNILLNGSNKVQARHALAAELLGEGFAWEEAVQLAQTTMRRIEEAFPDFKPFWCKGFGLKLQNIDSEICGRVLAALTARDIPVLGVHDSFIVSRRFHDDLIETMGQAFDEELSARGYKPGG